MTRVRRRLADDELSDPRDQQLLLLLASSGVLASVLSREERRVALRRLRKLQATHRARATMPQPGASKLVPPAHGAPPEVSADVLALGRVAYHVERDLLTDAVIDFLEGGGFELAYGLSHDGGGAGDGGSGGDSSGSG